MQPHLLVDVQFRRLRPLAAFGCRGLRPGRLQEAGLDVGAGLLALEEGDLVAQLLDGGFQLLDAVLLDADDGEQRLDQRRAFLGRDVGEFQLHTAHCTETRPEQLRQNPQLLRNYNQSTIAWLATKTSTTPNASA